jgi:hypothetical protein
MSMKLRAADSASTQVVPPRIENRLSEGGIEALKL